MPQRCRGRELHGLRRQHPNPARLDGGIDDNRPCLPNGQVITSECILRGLLTGHRLRQMIQLQLWRRDAGSGRPIRSTRVVPRYAGSLVRKVVLALIAPQGEQRNRSRWGGGRIEYVPENAARVVLVNQTNKAVATMAPPASRSPTSRSTAARYPARSPRRSSRSYPCRRDG